jgi:hypothetical protein
MSRVAIENGMIARRTPQVVVILRSQGVQQRKRPFAMQPFGTMALRVVCGVRLLVKGMAINFEVFLASHPAKPLSRPCGT